MSATKDLKWKRIFSKSGGKRYLQCHRATWQNLTLEIVPCGGFITVKRYWLTLRRGFNKQELLTLCFFKLKDAKLFVANLLTGRKAEISITNVLGIYS